MSATKHLLVTRFSAMGDVAMTVPVIKALLNQHPDVNITYVSRPEFTAFFDNIPRLNYFPANLNKQYKGFKGLMKLVSELKKQHKYDALADLHDNLRTKILRNLLKFSGIPFRYIDKGRSEKKLLTQFPNKVLKPLKLTTERYADVFRGLGYPVTLNHQLQKKQVVDNDALIKIVGEKTTSWIGIAPFAKHKGKIYPLDKTEEIIAYFNSKDIKLFLFGGSAMEEEICKQWELKYKNATSLVRRLTMQQELLLIRQLDVMMSMDSAAMHLASLEGIPVVSVWGATHHYAGFLGYGQSETNIVADDIECRPCSVYGNKPCFRKDYACLNNIDPSMVISKLNKFLI
ncbi:ADP-heptose:LPS heptosyltransferase [Mucilaginibacter frigoritolerans]|uniref:ADP-heptose:LPS heptosyltransferase n=1 Tax=Mucilaginibacter frigoritolerans TaxID=652788 RepID=A0A562UGJ2_9SPHI|nr:glycosyltransferase family 9 protein [Mucilaginibacter frigoritolerans]TWJ04739.1 ADP-heptose:LPS heptosyltransferase [Mucilaginibacter frigoritolerans]